MSVYNDIISQGYYYGKSKEEVKKMLASNNALHSQALTTLDKAYDTTQTVSDDGTVTQAVDLKLSAEQKKQQSALQQSLASLNKYREVVDKNITDAQPFELRGKEKAEIDAIGNLLMFNIATAQGTGALQAPDREVIESAIQIPTGAGGAMKSISSGGKDGVIVGIDNAISLLNSNLNTLTQGQEGEAYDEVPKDISSTLNATVEYARNNPDDEQAQQFLTDWDNNNINPKTGEIINKSPEQMTPVEMKINELYPDETSTTTPLPSSDIADNEPKTAIDTLTDVGIIADDPFGKFTSELKTAVTDYTDRQKEIYGTSMTDNFAEATLSQAGATAKLLNDVFGASMSFTTPDIIENVPKALVEAGMETETAKKVTKEWVDFETANPEMAQDLKDVGQVGMFATALVGGKNIKMKTPSGKTKIVSKENPVVKKAQKKNYKDMEDIVMTHSKLKKSREIARLRNGVDDVGKEAVDTGLLRGTVDDNGRMNTTGKGGAVETYDQQYIQVLNKVVDRELRNEGKTININTLKKQVDDDLSSVKKLRGSSGSSTKRQASREIDDLSEQVGSSEIPLYEVNNLKTSMYEKINYNKLDASYGRENIVKALKKIIVKESATKVATINKELSGRYAVKNFIQSLDGVAVKGGKLSKYSAEAFGGAVGLASGIISSNPWIGIATGGAGRSIAKELQGKFLKRTLNR